MHFDPCRPRHCAGLRDGSVPRARGAVRALRPLTLDRATRSDETLDTGTPVARVKVGE